MTDRERLAAVVDIMTDDFVVLMRRMIQLLPEADRPGAWQRVQSRIEQERS